MRFERQKNPHHSEFRTSGAGFVRLNEGYWGGVENFAVAADMGFSFQPHDCDNPGVVRSYNASHAEVQLMCFFVRRNYVFRHVEEGQDSVYDDFLQLLMLQERNRQADIVVSNTPCSSCRALRDCIRERLGINFTFRELLVT